MAKSNNPFGWGPKDFHQFMKAPLTPAQMEHFQKLVDMRMDTLRKALRKADSTPPNLQDVRFVRADRPEHRDHKPAGWAGLDKLLGPEMTEKWKS